MRRLELLLSLILAGLGIAAPVAWAQTSFSPTITIGGLSGTSYLAQQGLYQAGLAFVHVEGSLTINSIGTLSGNVALILPVTPNAGGQPIDFVINSGKLSGITGPVVVETTPGSSTAYLYYQAPPYQAPLPSGWSNLSSSNLMTGSSLTFSLNYLK